MLHVYIDDLVMRLMTIVMERETVLIMVDSCASARFVKLLGSHNRVEIVLSEAQLPRGAGQQSNYM